MRKLCSILFFISVLHANAQTTFTATVNKNKVSVNESFSLNFVLSNGDAKNFKAPSLSDFYILGGPNQSSQFQSINGKTSQSVSFNYVLQARTVGKYTIGSASIKSGNASFTTQPITIEVTEKPAQQNSGNSNSDNSTTDLNTYVKDNFYLRASVSDDEIYKGEQITVLFKLYFNKNSAIADYQITGMNKVPKYTGFYTQDIDMNNTPASTEVINGQPYLVYTIKKSILTAQQAGNLEIDPFSVDALIAVKTKSKKRNDPFSDIFGNDFPDPFSSNYERLQITSSSPAIKIKVNDLPANAPSDFNGAVGNFSMKTELNLTETKTDEPLTYRITISGTGNLNLFEAPVLSLPPGWETYDPKITDGNNTRTFEYLLIPRSPGEFTIPAHTWSYFDASKKQYITLNSESYNVKVEAGTNYTSGTNANTPNKEDVELLNQDIRYINKNEPSFSNYKNTIDNVLYYSVIGFPFIAGIFIFFISDKKNKLEKDTVALKNRRATSIAKKRLKSANILMKKNESKTFYDETIKALWGYLSDKLNIPQSMLSKETIANYLKEHHASDETNNAVLQLLNTCELALFAPQLAGTSLESVYKNAIKIISKLEDELR